MKKFFTLALLGGLLLGGFSSCKKDNNEPNPGTGGGTPSFVGKNWVVQSILLDPAIDLDGDGKPDSDMVPFLDDCNRDDSVVFQADGKMMEDHGAVLCDDDNNVKLKHTHNWTYDATSRKISLADPTTPSEVSTWDVLDLSSSTLNVRATILPEDGKTGAIKATMTMKAK
jgi:hypothetical protein